MNTKQQEINLQHDSVLYREYTEYMKTGATNMQALVQVAITNELEVITVFDALLRAEHRDLQGASVGD
nr:hypothetical protein [uncultured Duganella sp.]